MKRSRTEYTEEQLAEMERKLLALPPIPAAERKRGSQAGVIRLAQAIATLQERGYSIEQVAESMRGVEFEITTPTLKSYLLRAKEKNGTATTKKRKKRRPAATPVPASASASAATTAQGNAREQAPVAPSGPVATPATPSQGQGRGADDAPKPVPGKTSGEPPRDVPRSTNDEFLMVDRKKL